MSEPRPPKKTESVEVRMPLRLKQELSAQARREGRSVSDIVRGLIEDYVRRPAQLSKQPLETAMKTIRKHPARAGFAVILGAAGLSALLSSAIPAGAQEDRRGLFTREDTNGDGFITLAEREALQLEQRRAALRLLRDARESGMLREGEALGIEFTPGGEVAGTTYYRGDPCIDYAAIGLDSTADVDIMATPQDRFARQDADGDGFLSLEEFAADLDAIAERQEARVEAAFVAMDTGRDGGIDADEAAADPLGMREGDVAAFMTCMDTSGNGRISRREFAAFGR